MLGFKCLWASPCLKRNHQYLLCRGEKMVLGLLSRSLSFSRSLWLFGERASSSFLSLLKRSLPVRMMCSSILRWRFMSDNTLSSRASLLTEERAEDPGRQQAKIIINKRQNSPDYKETTQIIDCDIPGVLRRLRKAFFGVVCICSSSKSNSVGVGGLKKQNKK